MNIVQFATTVRVLCVFLVFVSIFFFRTADAALLYLDPQVIDIYRGDTATVALRIDTDEGECINTVDAVLHYDSNIRAVDVSRGDSILNVWLVDPVINEEEHTITLTGGLPGGYCGRIAGDPRLTNIIADIVFRSPGFSVGAGDNPTAEVRIDDSSSVLLHDGFGSPAPLRTQNATFNLLGTPGNTILDSWKDKVQEDSVPPSNFVITLATSSTAFSQKYFIVFNSQDKQSGIDHYEVMEEPFTEFYSFTWGRVDAPWVVATSPYVLNDQTLNSTIRVKAVDKAGNETVEVYVPEEALRSISRDRILMIAVVSMVSILLVSFVSYLIYRRKQKLIHEYSETSHESTP